MGIWQNWLCSMARWLNIPNLSQPNPGLRPDGAPCSVNSRVAAGQLKSEECVPLSLQNREPHFHHHVTLMERTL